MDDDTGKNAYEFVRVMAHNAAFQLTGGEMLFNSKCPVCILASDVYLARLTNAMLEKHGYEGKRKC